MKLCYSVHAERTQGWLMDVNIQESSYQVDWSSEVAQYSQTEQQV